MKASALSLTALSLIGSVLGVPQVEKRDDEGQFHEGQPISGDLGAPILGEFLSPFCIHQVCAKCHAPYFIYCIPSSLTTFII